MSARFQTVGPKRALRTIAIATILALATFGLSAIGAGAASAAPGSPRIVGGADIPISSAPYQVALIDVTAGDDFQGQFCGGSILSTQIIVTAAHCVDGAFVMANLRILAGSATLSTETVTTRQVSAVTVHPDWDAATDENDIAIIRLTSPLTFQAGTIEAISLPSSSIGENNAALVSGWGYTGYKNLEQEEVDANGDPMSVAFPTSLQGATVYTSSDANCLSLIGASFKSASMLCAGDFSLVGDDELYAQDTCQGDSGGPLAVTTGSVKTLAGITSWGRGCAWTEPGVYTKVSNYVTWLKSFSEITYSATTFDEATANDGSISTTVTITLSGDTFTGTNGAALGTVTNVPTGLTAVLEKASNTTATLNLTGNATTHTNDRNVSNLTVTFGNSDFTGGIASLVTGATKNNLAINFADPASLAFSTTTFVEAAANDGSITTTVTITLSGDTFTGTNGDVLGTVTNVPAGLTADLVRASATTATLSFTGNASTHTNDRDVSNLTVTFANADFTGGNASAVTGATRNNLEINFADPATSGGGGGGVSSPVVVVSPPSTGLAEPVSARVSGFAGNSATLNKTVRADIRAALRDNPGAKTATCRAFAPTSATPAETSLARSRAAASCAYIAKRAPALKITVVKGNLKATTDSQERRVRVIFG
jgi:secreted trypsin-like serine protease